MPKETIINIALEFMRLENMSKGDSVPVHAIIEFGISHGYNFEQVESDLIQAGASGWVVAIDLHIQLTKYGHSVLHPANDNASIGSS